jgi:hypothetical protein
MSWGCVKGGTHSNYQVTLASDLAIYIQDNFNTTDKVPASVNGDTLNVNSQSWERPRTSSGRTRANDRKTYMNMYSYRLVLGRTLIDG